MNHAGIMTNQINKIGAISGLIGSMILLSVGLSIILDARFPGFLDPEYPSGLPYMQAIITIIISAHGIFGAILAFKDNIYGYLCLLIVGIIGIIATFSPIFVSIAGGILTHIYFASSTFRYIDLVLILTGGILGLALKEKSRVRK